VTPLTHLGDSGEARMVDVGRKDETEREAMAEGILVMNARSREALFTPGAVAKGDALAAARIAGIMAAKRASELIPLCHALPLNYCEVEIHSIPEGALVRCTVRSVGRTGVEMEALTAVSVALLTLYDMLKSGQKDLRLTDVRLRRKSGGRSGELDLP
jgi:cyclic pyranopterin monophosphate synthase